jgi:hypothetical protein
VYSLRKCCGHEKTDYIFSTTLIMKKWFLKWMCALSYKWLNGSIDFIHIQYCIHSRKMPSEYELHSLKNMGPSDGSQKTKW